MVCCLSRVLYIHLDSADANLIRSWVVSGLLPNIGRLMVQGSSIDLDAPRGFGADAMLPSVYTGMDPSEHGRYYHSQETLGDTGATAASNSNVECETVWSVMQRQGRRTVVVDLPKAPVQHFAGVQVAQWKTHTSSLKDFRTVPRGLQAEIEQEFGGHTDCTCYAHRYERYDPSNTDEWLAEISDRIDAQLALTKRMLEAETWDVFMAGFCSSHCIGHQFWHLHDSDHPLHQGGSAEGGDPVELVYRKLDDAVGELVGMVESDVKIMLFAGPGFGSSYLRWDLLDDILFKLQRGKRSPKKQLLEMLKSLWHRLPDSLRVALSDIAHKSENSLAEAGRKSRANFPARLNDAVGGVILNRELISGQQEWDDLSNLLVRELAVIANLETGTPIVKDVFRLSLIHI